MCLTGRPEVLFLDEPTTGLDPISRNRLWDIVEHLAANGATVVLTTQYLEEADRLANEVVLLASGRVVASGTPRALKARIGARVATATFTDLAATRRALDTLTALGLRPLPAPTPCATVVPISAQGELTTVVRGLDAAGLQIRDLTVTEPTLNEVYVALHHATSGAST